MKFPCEIITEPYLAQLRIRIAKELHSLGLTQNQIAELLQVSQPVVSGYLKKTQNLSHLPEPILSRANSVGTVAARFLYDGGRGATAQAMNMACLECKTLRSSGPICAYHREITSELGEDCTACLTPGPLIELQIDKDSTLTDLRKVYQDLIINEAFETLIPEIGMQIVYGVEDPHSIDDIAAFPSRINKRKGSPPTAEAASFGSSETTSQLLLYTRARNNHIRAIATIKTKPFFIKFLEMRGITHFEINEFDHDHKNHIQNLFLRPLKSFAIYDMGSPALEPITYVFTSNIFELKELLLSSLR